MQTGRAGTPAPDRERFLLADVVEELAATATGPDGSAAALEGLAAADVLLDADFDQPYRILLNLVRNAFDAGARSLRISGRNAGESAVIELRDDGPGLPEAVAVAAVGPLVFSVALSLLPAPARVHARSTAAILRVGPGAGP